MVKVADLLQEQQDIIDGNDDTSINMLDDFYGYDSGYYDDILMELCDNQVDIYNNDLMDWLKEHYDLLEDYINENGTDGDFSLFETIRSVQYNYIYGNACEVSENFLYAYMYNYILHVLMVEEITEEQEENIDAIVGEFDELGDIMNEIQFRLGLIKGE